MQFVFGRRRAIGSWLIRFATWSEWSHVGIIDGDKVWHTTWPKGVHSVPFWEWVLDYPDHAVVDVPVPNEEAGLAWARSQDGVPYDLTGLIAFPFRRDWQNPIKWFCSEYGAMAALKAGLVNARDALGRITPQALWIRFTFLIA